MANVASADRRPHEPAIVLTLARRLVAGLIEPRTLLGIGAGISLLLVVGALADWREVAALGRRLPVHLVLLSAVAQLFGAACRAVRWLLMLRGGGLRVAHRPALAASFGSDLLGPLPASPLVASYLLHRAGAAPATATVPVVLAGLWVEVLVVVGGTAVVPDVVPPPVRLVAVLICGGAVVGAALLRWRAAHRVVWWVGAGLARLGRVKLGWWRAAQRFWTFLDGLPAWTPAVAHAFGPAALVPGVVLTALPMAFGTSVTAAIGAQLGYPQLTAPRVWAASGTVMVLALASPLPFDLGVVEGGQMLAYSWIGVAPAAGLALGLIGRVWNTTIGLLLAGSATWALRNDLG